MDKYMKEMKDLVQKELEKNYKAGINQGTILTCGMIYKMLKNMDFKENHIVYSIVKEIALSKGCEDLEEYCNKVFSPKGEHLPPS